MFGSELAFERGSRRHSLLYFLLGHPFLPLRIRAMHLRRMLKGIPDPSAILDAGSGDGAYSFYLARRFPRASVHGMESSQDLVDSCESIRTRLGLRNLWFTACSLADLAATEAYDLIVCIDVLEHIVEDEVALRKLSTSLTRNSILLLHVPQNRHLNRFILRPPGSAYVREHVRDEYTQEEIEGKIERAGLTICEKRYTFGWPGSIAREFYYLLNDRSGAAWHPLRLIAFPMLLLFGWLDTVRTYKSHQGFFYRLSRAPALVALPEQPYQAANARCG